jgi:hypothetical protein
LSGRSSLAERADPERPVSNYVASADFVAALR